jgi:hypothetical protein
MNMPFAGRLLMFCGSDAEGRTTLLVLQGKITVNDAKQRALLFRSDVVREDGTRAPQPRPWP